MNITPSNKSYYLSKHLASGGYDIYIRHRGKLRCIGYVLRTPAGKMPFEKIERCVDNYHS